MCYQLLFSNPMHITLPNNMISQRGNHPETLRARLQVTQAACVGTGLAHRHGCLLSQIKRSAVSGSAVTHFPVTVGNSFRKVLNTFALLVRSCTVSLRICMFCCTYLRIRRVHWQRRRTGTLRQASAPTAAAKTSYTCSVKLHDNKCIKGSQLCGCVSVFPCEHCLFLHLSSTACGTISATKDMQTWPAATRQNIHT